MRLQPTVIWDTWSAGGPFIGELRPTGRVTIEWDWQLTAASTGTGALPANKKPIRWYQRCDDSQTEMELPPIKSIEIDRSIDADAGTATIVFYNQQMRTNSESQIDLTELGHPGYYTMARGLGPEANARWGQEFNQWCFAITPNTLVRTYQGYGGRIEDMTIQEGVEAGYLLRTGVWFCDRVKVGTDGLITMTCRDAAKLLIEQQLYPPLVPRALYPLHYQRYEWKTETVNHTTTRTIPAQTGVARAVSVSDSTVDRWYPQGNTGSGLGSGGFTLHGHKASDAIDGNGDTFALSVGNGSPTASFAKDWWEFNVDGPVDTVYVQPWAGNYTMYISVLENGVWIDGGGGTIPWDNGPLYGNQPYVVNSQANIPFVLQSGVPWETGADYKLPRVYQASKVRVTFGNPTKSQWGPNYYRSGLREFKAMISSIDQQTISETTTEQVQVRHDGNYKDYADIVKDLLLWAGFWCFETVAGSEQPHVHGNIETTGIFAEDPLPDDLFDKRPVVDPITELKETVGYVTWVDDEGAFHFESPNWWQAGNFGEDGTYTDFIPDIDERLQLTGYTIDVSDDMLRSEIIISEEQSRDGPFGVVTRYTPPTHDILRGMVKPAMWTNGYFTNADEQKIMAELIGLHIYFRLRMGNIEAWANPCIQVNDQVRVYERITSTTYIHYVRGVQTQMDCDEGSYTMSLTTHWLGNDDDWAVET